MSVMFSVSIRQVWYRSSDRTVLYVSRLLFPVQTLELLLLAVPQTTRRHSTGLGAEHCLRSSPILTYPQCLIYQIIPGEWSDFEESKPINAVI